MWQHLWNLLSTGYTGSTVWMTESCSASDEQVKVMRGHVTVDLLLSAKLNGCVLACCCAKCKLTVCKWLKTKAGLSSFAILNSGNTAEAIRTCYCNCVQFMKHCTQYLFPLHSREKPVPYHWMHTVHLCLNTEVRGKQSELLTCAGRLLSPRLVLSVLPLWTMVLTGSTEKLLSYKKWHSLFFFICFVQRGERWHKFKLSNI